VGFEFESTRPNQLEYKENLDEEGGFQKANGVGS
jgi:hypothetical protein